jgi:hypothetical protein
MREPLDRLVRSHFDQLAHALQQQRHDGLIQVRADGEGLQSRLRVRGARGGLTLGALENRQTRVKQASAKLQPKM